MKLETVRKKLVEMRLSKVDAPPPPGTWETIAKWVRQDEDELAPLIEHVQYNKLLTLLPDHIVENLEKGRLAHDGLYPMLTAGEGFEELLFSVVASGPAVGTSAAEAKLCPVIVLDRGWLAPRGLPGKMLKFKARGRGTTLTTAATIIFRIRSATSDIITGPVWAASGGIIAHTTAQTNTQWKMEAEAVVQTGGVAGTVFCQGDADVAWNDLSTASKQAQFMGSAGIAAPAVQTVDTTVDEFLQVTAQWSLATAYSIQMHQYSVEALN